MQQGDHNRFSYYRISVLALLLSGSIYYLLTSFFPPYHQLSVEISAKVQASDFRVTPGHADAFAKSNLVSRGIGSSNDFTRASFVLPAVSLSQIQIEPGFSKAEIKISEICISRVNSTEGRCFSGADLKNSFRPRRDISNFRMMGDNLQIQSIGKYPRFESEPRLAEFLGKLSSTSLIPYIFISICLSVLTLAGASRASRFNFRLSDNYARAASVVFSLMLCGYFVFASSSLSRVSPPFEGADEPAHLSRFLAYAAELDCGDLPSAYRGVELQLRALRDSSVSKFSLAELLNSKSEPLAEKYASACRYNSLYVAIPNLFVDVQQILTAKTSQDVVSSLDQLRSAFRYSSLLVFSVSFVLIFLGKPLSWLKDGSESVFRVSAMFVVMVFLMLPQTLWLGAVLNQDYLLIGSGLFLAISLGLRIPLLSELCFVFALYAAASKGVYCLPFISLIAIHYYFLLSRRPKSRYVLLFGVLGILCLATLALVLNQTYCQDNFCFGIEVAGFFRGPSAFVEDIRLMLNGYSVLQVPNLFFQDSAFGSFGWLTVPLSQELARAYSSLLAVMFFSGLAGLAFLSSDSRVRSVQKKHVAFYSTLVVQWFFSLIAVYFIFLVMRNWCAGDSPLGCGYQRRYELPLYPPIALGISFFFLSFFRELRAVILTVTFFTQVLVGVYVFQRSAEELQARYFSNSVSILEYQEFLDSAPARSEL